MSEHDQNAVPSGHTMHFTDFVFHGMPSVGLTWHDIYPWFLPLFIVDLLLCAFFNAHHVALESPLFFAVYLLQGLLL